MEDRTAHVEVKKETSKEVTPRAESQHAAHPLVSLRREVDRLFEDFATSLGSWPLGRSLFDDRAWRFPRLAFSMPAVDVTESEKEYRITAELPGMNEKDIEVTISDDVLTVKGEKKEEKEETRKDYRLSERHYGAFQRSFVIPPGADAGKIAASFSKGVLTVTLAKTEQAQRKPKKVEIKSA